MLTTKQRAYLKGLAMNLDPIYQIGKSSLTPEITKGIDEALKARELVKIAVLNNCLDDPKELGSMVAERTRSELVPDSAAEFYNIIFHCQFLSRIIAPPNDTDRFREYTHGLIPAAGTGSNARPLPAV